MKKKKIGIMAELMLLVAVPLLVLAIVITSFAIGEIRSVVKEEAISGLSLLCTSVNSAGDKLDEGDYVLNGEDMYKGDYKITSEEVEKFVADTPAQVTIFYGDTRRATSLIDAETGERIVGTKASDEVIEHVLQNGEEYESTDIQINGEQYVAVYEPLRNPDGSIIGMIFAGEPFTEVNQTISKITNTMIAIAAIVWLLAMGASCIFAKMIAGAIVQAEKLLLSLSEGNLQVELSGHILKRKDEIGMMAYAISTLTEQLQQLMGSIKNNISGLKKQGDELESVASQTAGTSDGISTAVEDISRGAVSMAEDIETATMQINNIGDIISKIVDSVHELDSLSEGMHNSDMEASKIINELSESNDKTTEAIGKIAESVRTTNDSVTRIQEAVNLIASIASETSLLALNASIEAARAGEAGKGFAVVATQISKLSDDSNQSALAIEQIIQQLAADSEASVKIMDEVDAIVAEQQKKLNETKQKFMDVSKGIEDSTEETKIIDNQTMDCDHKRQAVMDVFANLSAVSQENASSTQQTTASMEELNATINLLAQEANDLKDVAQSLEQEVAFFNV
jgi:methyl-accepting chemotaxis protein